MNMYEHRDYFNRKKPFTGIVLVVFGIITLMLGFLLGGSVESAFLWAMLGSFLIASGVYFIIKIRAQESDRALDKFCSAQAEEYFSTKKIVVESREKGIVDSVFSSGYCFENLFSARRAIRGKDKVWRSSIYEMSSLFFSENKVYYYSKKISLMTDEKCERQNEFRLQDIQSVALEEVNQSVVVAIVIPGNEKIFVNCKNKEEAIELCDRIKNKVFEGE